MTLFCLVFSAKVFGQELRVLPSNPERAQTEEMLRSYFRRLANEAFDRRVQAYEELKTSEQIVAYQSRLLRLFIEHLGGFPKRTPLRPRVVDSRSYDGYRIERILYESRPNFHVPALLYLPNQEPPYPGVLVLAGHGENGKADYQEIGVFLARNGMAALCPDPIGQGERRQVVDWEAGNVLPPTTEHMIAGVAPILLGENLATYMIWDAMRAIDYLVSRPEIDGTRIGCTGNSGGGNRTSYLMALDDRVLAAAPSCFITTNRRKNESPGPGDVEQNIHGQIAFGMDHSDYVLMRAPRPTLILSATQDYVPIEGAWESFREAKRLYTRLGFPERVSLVEADQTHGFSPELRAGTVGWMRRWLLQKDSPAVEVGQPVLGPEELECTPEGQVMKMRGERSVFDLYVEREEVLRKEREDLWRERDPGELRGMIRSLAGIRALADLPKVRYERRGTVERSGYQIEKIVLRSEPGIDLPALHFRSAEPTGGTYLYVNGGGKDLDAGPGGAIEALVREGHEVLAVDLRGCGETRTTPWRYQGALEFVGDNVAEFFIAYMLGKSFVGMRAEDILVSAGFLAGGQNGGREEPVHLIAIGSAGPAALHASALEPELFASVTIRRSLVSWENVVRTPISRGALINVVHGALGTYDLPNLVTLAETSRIRIEEPIDASGNPIR